MPKYYGGHDGMLLQLASMSFVGCSVVVAGRAVTDDEGSSSFKTFEDVDIPEVLTKLVGLQLPDHRNRVAPSLLAELSRNSFAVCVLPSGCTIMHMGAGSGTVFIHTRRGVPE